MLTLTRHEGESLIINETIKITLIHAEGGVASVEIDAPDEVVIVRQELLNNDIKQPE